MNNHIVGGVILQEKNVRSTKQCCKTAPTDKVRSTYNKTIELSSDSTWLLVGSWLFCIQRLSHSVRFWCLIRGSGEVRTKKNSKIVHCGSNSYIGMPRGPTWSLVLNEPK